MSIDNEYVAILNEFTLFSENSREVLCVPIITFLIRHIYLTTILHFLHLTFNFIFHFYKLLSVVRWYAGMFIFDRFVHRLAYAESCFYDRVYSPLDFLWGDVFLIGFPTHATPLVKRRLFLQKRKSKPQRMKFAR